MVCNEGFEMRERESRGGCLRRERVKSYKSEWEYVIWWLSNENEYLWVNGR